jgi:hypothetical protein
MSSAGSLFRPDVTMRRGHLPFTSLPISSSVANRSQVHPEVESGAIPALPEGHFLVIGEFEKPDTTTHSTTAAALAHSAVHLRIHVNQPSVADKTGIRPTGRTEPCCCQRVPIHRATAKGAKVCHPLVFDQPISIGSTVGTDHERSAHTVIHSTSTSIFEAIQMIDFDATGRASSSTT